MIVKATEIKNNFGKYLKQLETGDIIVTKNGSPVARISKCDDWGSSNVPRYFEKVCETAMPYNFGGIKMTFEEFLEMREKTDDRYEYIDGQAFYTASPAITHQRVIGNLYSSFRLWFKGKKCMPYLSPFDVTLVRNEKDMNLVQPDILIVCDPENKNEKDRYTGIPSLVVEVLSETSRRMDLVRKLNLYMDTRVSEYWIIDPFKREVVVYDFIEDGAPRMNIFLKEDTVKSVAFDGLTVPLADVFE